MWHAQTIHLVRKPIQLHCIPEFHKDPFQGLHFSAFKEDPTFSNHITPMVTPSLH